MEPLGVVPDNGQEEDQIFPLSGKPYFHIFLAQSHLEPLYKLTIPLKMYCYLPDSDVPAVLDCCGKTWKVTFNGAGNVKMFDRRWRKFAEDKDLKKGDACLFEIMEFDDGVLKFRVQILRDDFPDELIEGAGASEEIPIAIEE